MKKKILSLILATLTIFSMSGSVLAADMAPEDEETVIEENIEPVEGAQEEPVGDEVFEIFEDIEEETVEEIEEEMTFEGWKNKCLENMRMV